VDLAGGRIDYPQFAQSLTTCVEAPETRVREESLSEFAGKIMLRNEQWKLAVNRNGESYLLFDLENDPLESRNLAGLKDYRPVETELRLHLLERLVAAQLA
jgi:choline-sulfatase